MARNKSHILSKALRNISVGTLSVPHPNKEELIKVAEHIEWLEACLSGINVKDRKQIVNMNRTIKRRDKTIETQKAKIKQLKQELKDMKSEHKQFVAQVEKEMSEEIEYLERKLTEGADSLRAAIERDFIARLQETYEVDRKESMINMLRIMIEQERISWRNHRQPAMYNTVMSNTSNY